jgi:CHAT domain-containing protein
MASICRCAGVRSERGRQAAVALLLAAWATLSPAAATTDTALDEGRCQLRDSQWRTAARTLQAAHDAAAPGPDRSRAAAALGQAWLQQDQAARAAPLLEQAAADGGLTPRERAAAALDLASARAALQQPAAADAAWSQALALAGGDVEIALAVELNRLRQPQSTRRLARLQAVQQALQGVPPGPARARLALNLAAQALALGPAGQALAQAQYEAALALALDQRPAPDDALAAEAHDGLGAVAEARGQLAQALRHAERGLRHAQALSARELAVPLEWRAGRLARQLGRDDLALAAYRRAVDAIETVRADIPVRYRDGRSSFRETLEPVYLGLTDLLLRQAAAGPDRGTLLRQARDTVELIKQTELEDYLRDRCGLASTARTAPAAPAAGTAVYYPIILPDRLELLLETADGIEAFRVDVSGDDLRRMALNFVAALRAKGGYRSQAEQLYTWLLKPLEATLARAGVHTLVAVPDGVLRLVPLAALHDGRDFVVSRLAVATAPGLSMRPAGVAASAPRPMLVAGMSEPGPVVDRLPPEVLSLVLDADGEKAVARAAAGAAGTAAATDDPALRDARRKALREALSLPGVRRELDDVGRTLGTVPLLDQDFTLAALRQRLQQQDPAVVHIASHGVFGDSADTTFIMTYDELLTLDALQQLLAAGGRRRAPIELITLSACQTAEGDDRAPLGMSGTAIRARARSALGTLWPVADEAAQQLMAHFYQRLSQPGAATAGKAAALRDAQLQLLQQPRMRHPFYWAPFTLVGDWS